MNNRNDRTENALEEALRSAPKPAPPSDLKAQLLARAGSAASPRKPRHNDRPIWGEHWLKRWWPTLVPAGLSLFCVAVVAVQQSEIRSLRKQVEKISAVVIDSNERAVASPQKPAVAPAPSGSSTELRELQQTARELNAEVARLEQLQAENVRLRTDLSRPAPGVFSAEELAAVQQAQDRTAIVKCVNQMKQLGLATLMCASDNADIVPTDVTTIAKYLPNPALLVCPGDKVRQPAQNWETFTMANCSYEWFLPPQTSIREVKHNLVLTRCTIHEAVGLYDGSVQNGKKVFEQLVNRDGKLYLNLIGDKAADVVPLSE